MVQTPDNFQKIDAIYFFKKIEIAQYEERILSKYFVVLLCHKPLNWNLKKWDILKFKSEFCTKVLLVFAPNC